MAIDFESLGPRAKEQVMAKLAIEKSKQMQKSKYRAEKVEAVLEDGTPFTFASRKEYQHYKHLLMLQRCGEISDLRLQVKYPLIPPQKLSTGKMLKGIDYIADFVYRDASGKETVVDVKGYRNAASAAYRVFHIKKKLMMWIHGIEVQEV